jgi:hypothetical protein
VWLQVGLLAWQVQYTHDATAVVHGKATRWQRTAVLLLLLHLHGRPWQLGLFSRQLLMVQPDKAASPLPTCVS